MLGRIAVAALLLLSACRLSDEQQVGVLKFVASSITGAVATDAQAAPKQQVKVVRHAQPCPQTGKVARMTVHRMRHIHTRMQYAASRFERAMASVRRIICFENATVAHKCRKTPAPAVRS
jgi:hypothetical protein